MRTKIRALTMGVGMLVAVCGMSGQTAWGEVGDLAEGLSYTHTLGPNTIFNVADTDPVSKLTDGQTKVYYGEGGTHNDEVLWQYNDVDTNQIEFDLGELCTISEVGLHVINGAYYGLNSPHIVNIDYSTDGETWSDMADWTNPVGHVNYEMRDGLNPNLFVWQTSGELTGMTGRYVRIGMEFTTVNGYNWFVGIDEIRVLGEAGTGPVNTPGDANGDGMVDVGDLGILAGNYGTLADATWTMGDFNGDGAVDVGDLGILAGNYGIGTTPADSVPEPVSLGLLGAGGLFLIRRKR